jgi:hypothetical protein
MVGKMEAEVSLSDAADGVPHEPDADGPAPAPPSGHNSFQELLDRATVLGGQAASGVTALQMLGLEVMEASHDGVVRPEGANQIAKNYADGLKNAGGTPGSVATLASKFRKLMELGKLNNGLKIAKEALRLRGETKKPKSPFETLVEIARHCGKSKNCELADDEIKAIISRPEPRAKTKAKAEPEPGPNSDPDRAVAEAQFTGWRSVAVQVDELTDVKDEEGERFAHALIAKLENYLRNDITEADADQPAALPDDTSSVPEANEVQEAAYTPPAVIVHEEENAPGEPNE